MRRKLCHTKRPVPVNTQENKTKRFQVDVEDIITLQEKQPRLWKILVFCHNKGTAVTWCLPSICSKPRIIWGPCSSNTLPIRTKGPKRKRDEIESSREEGGTLGEDEESVRPPARQSVKVKVDPWSRTRLPILRPWCLNPEVNFLVPKVCRFEQNLLI